MSHSNLLAQVPLFSSLGSDDQERLSARLQSRRYPRGEVIFHQGDTGTDLYIIREGEVTIRLSAPDGREVSLALLRRGDAFGELALLDEAPRSTDAVAREETHLLSLHRADLQRFLQERPQVVPTLLAELSRLVRRVTRTVHDASFLDARARLARVLLDLAQTQGQPGTEGVALTSRLTQTELANLAGLTRESTNRWLRFYVREGLLTYEEGRITLLEPDHLRMNAD
ncbi:Crp/Fnr family transcriptional regulator [Vitiosangium sp. GDMCC 1.1324]|uniref:Crp/Fnr family transcriptional regulator n=1 Tax=Vitiosangium sp. (strain GDMCC 1.1324) TaxID=2138576 RepID=UPI000D3C7627|nr:Crp/Fnr family transcriptional regulator [Vitiosangium sp. GDMCC 1.1324]PTL80593.1 Crp/Fnr family transcriptional regulator [Vitiosangium sp. GDMCC 1.1324]